VLWRERLDARLWVTFPVRAEIVRLEQDRLVPVVPHRVPVALLPEVEGDVLVAEDRMDHLLAGVGGELRQRLGPHELVLHDREWDRHAGHTADRGPPDAGAHEHLLTLDVTPIGPDAVHAALPEVEPGDTNPALERDALRLGLRPQGGRHPDPLRDPVRGDEVRAQDVAGIEDRDPLGRLLGREELGPLDAICEGVPAAPLQLPHPLRRRRDLDAADAVPGGQALGLEPRVQVDRILRELAHRPRAVRLEHEARRVRGRPTRLEQRPLIEHEHVRDAEFGQVVRGARAHDPGADHDELRAILHV
jgi:hypothetical protein